VTRDDFLEWRDRLLEGRQARTVNRHVRSVVAALNRAVDLAEHERTHEERGILDGGVPGAEVAVAALTFAHLRSYIGVDEEYRGSLQIT
jgi:hypothetical protein